MRIIWSVCISGHIMLNVQETYLSDGSPVFALLIADTDRPLGKTITIACRDSKSAMQAAQDIANAAA